ncbi:hypothetical protein C8Q79DRAFT_680193 [Trametes meyenii]|nr:hypothetical protein C8Q79DRAFT_680193 [Trametes meyenii]
MDCLRPHSVSATRAFCGYLRPGRNVHTTYDIGMQRTINVYRRTVSHTYQLARALERLRAAAGRCRQLLRAHSEAWGWPGETNSKAGVPAILEIIQRFVIVLPSSRTPWWYAGSAPREGAFKAKTEDAEDGGGGGDRRDRHAHTVASRASTYSYSMHRRLGGFCRCERCRPGEQFAIPADDFIAAPPLPPLKPSDATAAAAVFGGALTRFPTKPSRVRWRASSGRLSVG